MLNSLLPIRFFLTASEDIHPVTIRLAQQGLIQPIELIVEVHTRDTIVQTYKGHGSVVIPLIVLQRKDEVHISFRNRNVFYFYLHAFPTYVYIFLSLSWSFFPPLFFSIILNLLIASSLSQSIL